MPLSADMPSVPPDLRAAAEASDAEVENMLAGLIPAPDQPYSAKVVSALAKAISAVGKVMGIDLKPETYSGPVPELEPDFVRFLAMMDAAARDFGAPLPIPLEQIKGDKELTVLTAALMDLAGSPDFKDFLNMPMEEGAGEMETEVEVKVKPGKAGGEMEMEEGEEFDFGSRMKPRR